MTNHKCTELGYTYPMDILPDPDKPLAEEDLAFLESILTKYGTNETLKNLSDLDGFLTAIVSGPDMIMPSEWLPEIWGGEDQAPAFEDIEEVGRFAGCVMRLMNESASILAGVPAEFAPVTYVIKYEGSEIDFIGFWCLGYLRGAALRAESWENMDEDVQVAFGYIAVCSESVFEDSKIGIDEVKDGHETLIGAVIALYKYWLERRRPPQGLKSGFRFPNVGSSDIDGEKIGVNQPCPCGSGRKFKKCCGGRSNLYH